MTYLVSFTETYSTVRLNAEASVLLQFPLEAKSGCNLLRLNNHITCLSHQCCFSLLNYQFTIIIARKWILAKSVVSSFHTNYVFLPQLVLVLGDSI